MRFLISVLLIVASPVWAEWVSHEINKDGHANSVVATDYDGDKKMEIISSNNQEVWLAYGKDHKKKKVLFSLRPKLHRNACMHSCLMDVDNDGDLDFVGSSKSVFWLECPEDPINDKWQYRLISDELKGTHCVIAYYVDNDGKKELVANSFASEGKYSHSICWLQLGENKESSWEIYSLADKDAPGGTHYFSCTDLNGDGNVDLVIGAKGKPFKDGDYFAAWYSGKDPKLPWTKKVISDNQQHATNIMPAYVDKDKEIDLIATRGHGKGILWFKGPDWQPFEIDASMIEPHSLDVGDIDGDGDTDLASCGYGSQIVAWYENDGSGKFTRHVVATNQESYDLRLKDIDGDGDLDILNAGRATKNVIWFENRLAK